VFIGHPKTPAALQVKVVLATLPYTHPKQSSRPQKPTVIADRHGFEVDTDLAKKGRSSCTWFDGKHGTWHSSAAGKKDEPSSFRIWPGNRDI
jgi:hypothetical protein